MTIILFNNDSYLLITYIVTKQSATHLSKPISMIRQIPFKIFVYSILISLIFACKNDAKIVQNEFEVASDTINFQWQKLKQGGITINHGAILIPVTLEGIDKTFKMQLDLGINHNVIYGDTLAAITSAYPELQNNIQHRDGYEVFYNRIQFSNHQLAKEDSLLVRKNVGKSENLKDFDIIGTLGANEIKNKILLIDFKSQQLVITNKLEDWEEDSFSYTPLIFKNNQLHLDLIAAGNKHPFVYSTQASLLPLATIDANLFKNITKENTSEIKKLKSWGEEISFTGSDITTKIRIADVNLPINNKKAFFTDAKKVSEALKTENIKGIIGSDLFMNNTIMIDLVNNRFGIK